MKIYIGEVHKEDPLISLVYPFVNWDCRGSPLDPDYTRWDNWIEEGKKLYELTDNIQDCDFAVLPFPLERLQVINN
jgi:hypothetical protein